jgi:hypothetical protein
MAAPEVVTSIEPNEVPRAAPLEEKGKWHLIDLILAMAATAIGFYIMICALSRRKEYDEETSARGRRTRMWGPFGMSLGIVSVIALLVTQDFTGDMGVADVWSVLFAVIAGVNALALGLTSAERNEWKEEREQ